MVACPSCRTESPVGFRYCLACATPLGAAAAVALPEERKVVTALFCDLVGFTASSDRRTRRTSTGSSRPTSLLPVPRSRPMAGSSRSSWATPSSVCSACRPRARTTPSEPSAQRSHHRGRRAAAGDGGAPPPLRVGVNTGEALVRLGVAPGSGERFLAGDAVNTASRIQSVAPRWAWPSGSGRTRPPDGLRLRGAQPARSRARPSPYGASTRGHRGPGSGGLTRTHGTPFIGREIDLALLEGFFDKTVAAASPQLVTVVGEPGLGKSRIVAELGAYLDGRPDSSPGVRVAACHMAMASRSGRSARSSRPTLGSSSRMPPTSRPRSSRWFCPRDRAGLVPGAAPAAARDRDGIHRRSRGAVHRLAEVPRPRRGSASGRRSCSRTSIGRTTRCSHSSNTSPTGPKSVPLLVVGTARPELFERHPEYTVGMRNVNTTNLAPLTDEETRQLIAALLETAVVPAELARPILERAEGNPLYAEEFVRLLRDKDLLVRPIELGPSRGRHGPAPRFGPGPHRRSPGHAFDGGEVAARRRRRHREGLLGRGDRGDG